MLYVILSVFAAAACAPWLVGVFRHRVGWVLALVPAASTLYFANFIASVGDGAVVLQSWQWLPGLDINLSFMLDGLSLMFALLISFIGTFVLIYAGSYLKGHIYLGRFYATLLCFMASMLGLVLSDNLISLFVFWELTSVTSYLLIGFNHENKDARKYALQGLFVTAGGGLALMAGLILLGWSSGSYELSSILAGDSLAGHPLAAGMILCILLGTFTKSAQFPFHFWLPNAMAAPTPVSAYLHSATMVKAGVYLMARLNPALGEHPLWMWLLCSAGATTMVLGAYLSYSATGVKKVLAYSTVMALGTLTLLIGIGTETAMIAFASFLLAHSLYKGALFMVAGSLDHATGTKDLTLMGGLRKPMPITAAAALVAGLSLAGLPPLFGFVGKELLLGAALDAPWMGNAILAATVVAAALGVAVAAIVAIKPFFGPLGDTPKQAHETAIAMWIGPAVLAATSLIFGVLPFLPEDWFLAAAVTSVHGSAIDFYLSLWHGINLPLILSMINLVAGVALYKFWQHKQRHLAVFNGALSRFGPEAGYFKTMDSITRVAAWQTRVLQNGVLGNYMIVLVLAAVGLVGYTLLSQHPLNFQFAFGDLKFYEAVIAVFMAASTIYVICTRSRLAAVASVGVLGFSVALIFIHFSAPDLGITQMLVETLTVILLVLVLFKLPSFSNYSTRFEVIRDAIVAALFGILMMLLVMAAIDMKFFDSISAYFIDASYPAAKGRNIVNVILVDFRALDTLGEIFVLAIAALGVFSMLHLHGEKKANDQ